MAANEGQGNLSSRVQTSVIKAVDVKPVDLRGVPGLIFPGFWLGKGWPPVGLNSNSGFDGADSFGGRLAGLDKAADHSISGFGP